MLILTAIRYVYNCGLPEVQGSCVDKETNEYLAPGLNFTKLYDPSNAGFFNHGTLSLFYLCRQMYRHTQITF